MLHYHEQIKALPACYLIEEETERNSYTATLTAILGRSDKPIWLLQNVITIVYHKAIKRWLTEKQEMILDEITMQKILCTENPQKGGKDAEGKWKCSRVYFLKSWSRCL